MFGCWCLVCRCRPGKDSACSGAGVAEEGGGVCKPVETGLGVAGEGLGGIFVKGTQDEVVKGTAIEALTTDIESSFRAVEEHHEVL